MSRKHNFLHHVLARLHDGIDTRCHGMLDLSCLALLRNGYVCDANVSLPVTTK